WKHGDLRPARGMRADCLVEKAGMAADPPLRARRWAVSRLGLRKSTAARPTPAPTSHRHRRRSASPACSDALRSRPDGVNPREDGGRLGLAAVGISTEAARNPKGGIPVSFTTYLAPDPSEVSRARRFIREGCQATYLRPDALQGIVLAVSEACANAVEHAGASKVKVTWDRGAEGVVVEVADDGRFEQEPASD